MCVIADFGSRQPKRGGRVLSQRRLPGAAPAQRPVHSLGFSLFLYPPLAARLDFQKPLQSAGRPLALPTLQGNDQPETLGDNNRSLLFLKCFCYARFFRFRCEINKGPPAPKTYSRTSPPAPQISMLGSLCAMRFYKNGLLFISASLHSTFLRSQH